MHACYPCQMHACTCYHAEAWKHVHPRRMQHACICAIMQYARHVHILHECTTYMLHECTRHIYTLHAFMHTACMQDIHAIGPQPSGCSPMPQQRPRCPAQRRSADPPGSAYSRTLTCDIDLSGQHLKSDYDHCFKSGPFSDTRQYSSFFGERVCVFMGLPACSG